MELCRLEDGNEMAICLSCIEKRERMPKEITDMMRRSRLQVDETA